MWFMCRIMRVPRTPKKQNHERTVETAKKRNEQVLNEAGERKQLIKKNEENAKQHSLAT